VRSVEATVQCRAMIEDKAAGFQAWC